MENKKGRQVPRKRAKCTTKLLETWDNIFYERREDTEYEIFAKGSRKHYCGGTTMDKVKVKLIVKSL